MQPLANSLPFWAQVVLAFVPAVAAVFAAVGLWLNVAQSKKTNAQARASVVAKCLERFTSDQDMQAIFYKIEYSEFFYSKSTFHNSAEEKQLDKMLMHFSMAALAWRSGLLKIEDLQPLQYFVRRVLRDSGVKDYLQNNSEWSAKAGLGSHPYAVLLEMGKVLETQTFGVTTPVRITSGDSDVR